MRIVFAIASLGLYLGLGACRATVGPGEECRTVKVHNGREREECITRCGDEGCRNVCREHERTARERRCWVD